MTIEEPKKSLEIGEIIPNWIRPDLQIERGEVKRVVQEFLKLEPNEQDVERVMGILNSAPFVELSDKDWELLQNTDSFKNVRPGHLEDVEQIVEIYNKVLEPKDKRDFNKTLSGFIEGKEMQSPAILKNNKGELHLVSGNTRLMISRALGVRPEVVIGELD